MCNANVGSGCDDQNGRPTWRGWALPSSEQTRNAGMIPDNEDRSSANGGRTKKVVRINID